MEGIGFKSEKIEQYFKGEWNDTDAAYINKVFCDDSKEPELKSLLSRQFYELMPEDDLDEKDLDHILHRIHYNLNTKISAQKELPFDNIIKWSLRIAGVIILPLIIVFGIKMFKDVSLKNEAWVEIKAPAWTRVQFSLPDGTTGWLNSNSSVKYNGNFNADRKITLRGEAFFDVFKDKKRPFIVNTNEVSVTVLGTRFNIASYENERDIEVVLEEGKLVFNEKTMKKSYTMNPNDLVRYDKSRKDFSTEVVQPQKYLSWTEGKLVFRNDPLDIVARRLERWYNIDVVVNVISAEDHRWRATFNNEGPEEVLDLLKRSMHVNYRIENPYLTTDGTYTKKKVIIFSQTK
jgi:transmembrane sensor